MAEILGYDWMSHDVCEHNSRYMWENKLVDLVERFYILGNHIDDYIVNLRVCKGNEQVSHGRGDSKSDFFFVYGCFFSNLYVRVPFDDFQTRVLWGLNVAMTQLHLNA